MRASLLILALATASSALGEVSFGGADAVEEEELQDDNCMPVNQCEPLMYLVNAVRHNQVNIQREKGPRTRHKSIVLIADPRHPDEESGDRPAPRFGLLSKPDRGNKFILIPHDFDFQNRNYQIVFKNHFQILVNCPLSQEEMMRDLLPLVGLRQAGVTVGRESGSSSGCEGSVRVHSAHPEAGVRVHRIAGRRNNVARIPG